MQVSWPGNVGSLSGFSQQQIAISEIGVSFADDRFAFHFVFLVSRYIFLNHLNNIVASDRERTTHHLKRSKASLGCTFFGIFFSTMTL